MDNRPIGIFDSGVGGLTVTSRVINELPNEEIVYFGVLQEYLTEANPKKPLPNLQNRI